MIDRHNRQCRNQSDNPSKAPPDASEYAPAAQRPHSLRPEACKQAVKDTSVSQTLKPDRGGHCARQQQARRWSGWASKATDTCSKQSGPEAAQTCRSKLAYLERYAIRIPRISDSSKLGDASIAVCSLDVRAVSASFSHTRPTIASTSTIYTHTEAAKPIHHSTMQTSTLRQETSQSPLSCMLAPVPFEK